MMKDSAKYPHQSIGFIAVIIIILVAMGTLWQLGAFCYSCDQIIERNERIMNSWCGCGGAVEIPHPLCNELCHSSWPYIIVVAVLIVALIMKYLIRIEEPVKESASENQKICPYCKRKFDRENEDRV
ncbi:hypothetical protein M0R72_15170 [Candidatus Pacearchaeota archaeon]|jgi:hypothetical protein|nr:hypothetical protein [Candidatus Pacearchaeota archaeon]